MSTTSLSSCDDYEYYPSYNYVVDDSYTEYLQSCQGPYYNTMGQPLVYYAEVPYCMRSSKGCRKSNRNCFSKAFKWYTQEREPQFQRRVSPELSGFATWLDEKYGEYLRESEGNQSCCPTQPLPSTNDTVPTAPRAPCAPCQANEPCTTKRYGRMRSPWRKFRCHNKNGGDVPHKTPNGSCQFILQPKDLTRPASECYQTPTNCPNKSNTTVISTELEGTKKNIVKSQSMTNICQGKISKNHVDLITTQEGPMTKQMYAQKCRDGEKTPQVCAKSGMPCNQSCKMKQEAQLMAEIQIAPTKVQKVDVPCDPNSCKGCKPREEAHRPAKPQNVEVTYNPECSRQECKPVGDRRTPAEVQNMDIPYDPNCSRQECKLTAELPLPVKVDIPFDPNECKRDNKPITQIRLSTHTQNMDILYDLNCSRQECHPVEETQVSKSQTKDMPCDSNCIYKQKPNITAPADKIRGDFYKQSEVNKSQIKDIPCDTTCFHKQPKPEMQGTTRSQNKNMPCDLNSTCKQGYKSEGEIRSSTKPQNINIPCDPTCNKQQSEYTRNMKGPEKSQTAELPCDSNCIYKQDYKQMTEMQRTPTKSQIPCMCYATQTTTVLKLAPSNILKIDHECQCPEDETLPVDVQVQWECSHQTFSSTSNNNSLCKCISEKPISAPVQVPPRKPIIQSTAKAITKSFVPFYTPKKLQKQFNTTDVSCQCPDEDIVKFDMNSQYDRGHFETRCDCAAALLEKSRAVHSEHRPDCRPTTNYSSVTVRQVTRPVTIFRNDGVQTSDHSICLEDVGHDYAFFMKIVCADKLNDCFCDSLAR